MTPEEVRFSPPYIYIGLYEYEEMMRRPACDRHVRDYRETERCRREREQLRDGGLIFLDVTGIAALRDIVRGGLSGFTHG